MIAHWDEVEPYRLDHNLIHGEWTDLGRAAGTVGVGVRRIRLAPGEIPTPEHMHPVEEESHEIREGHIISRPPSTGIAHFFRAGPDGMRFLAYGTREANDLLLPPLEQTVLSWIGTHRTSRVTELR
jgi:uncharacterized cupin superfamily protein